MRFMLPSLVLVVGLGQVGVGTWVINFYEKGCPQDGDSTDPNLVKVGSTSGQADQQIWCYRVDSAHTAVLTGIEADNMKVELFADWQCLNLMESWTTDGCIAVYSEEHTVIAAARIMPN
ncbi:uncharacterized protein B0T15DRAFT_325568 [Chaetomium strumarium]|uniref:Uncharacterized protein n=1 Tax=Chaetomium strumarium TaxID=1170767 RepID=A0AAJ0LY32_9PEZI|nr:hypothetical protein B0T15DRAFT_325568 [Chaetomium strumarium]